jgi:ABC-2 type transport system ATP-binding protein
MRLEHRQEPLAGQVATARPQDTSPRSPWIVADGLTKRFGDHLAVDALSFEVPRGVVTGFLGPNGAGKTTTMRMILGLVRPSAGTATIGGRRFAELPDPARQVGVAIDGAAAHPRRSGRNHLRILAAERGVAPRRVDEVLASVELIDSAQRNVGEYSLGMRQRLQLASALLGEPPALVLDEPANGLDPAGIRWLRDFLQSYAREGGTVFVSSHQLLEMSRLADEVVVINHGRLVRQTSVHALTAGRTVRVSSPEADAIARAVTLAGGVVRKLDEATLTVSEMAAGRIGAISLEIGAVLHELVSQNTELEDVFLELTSEEEVQS